MTDLCALTGGKPEFVTLECVPSQWVRDGQPEAGFPFVELVWFERPQEMQDAAAALITRHLKGVLGSRPMWWCRCCPSSRVTTTATASTIEIERVSLLRQVHVKRRPAEGPLPSGLPLSGGFDQQLVKPAAWQQAAQHGKQFGREGDRVAVPGTLARERMQ